MKILKNFQIKNELAAKAIRFGLFFFFFSFFIQGLKAQDNQTKIDGSAEWKLVKSTSEVKIFSKEVLCIDPINGFNMKKVLIKAENLTSNTITLDWDKKLYYDNECLNCQTIKEEYHVNLILTPNQKIESDCSSNDELNIFIQMIGRNSEKLTGFEIRNFTIIKN